MSRRSSQVNVSKDIELKKWDKRTEAYLQLVTMLDKQSPDNAPNIDTVVDRAADRSAPMTAIDLTGDEWRVFDVRMRLFASKNVATLYAMWKALLADWTFARTSLVINSNDWVHSTTTEEEALRRELGIRAKMALLRHEILLHVRSELDFRTRRLPTITHRPGGVTSIVIPDNVADADMEVYVGNDAQSVFGLRKGDGGWHVDTSVETGSRAEDFMNADKLREGSTKKPTSTAN